MHTKQTLEGTESPSKRGSFNSHFEDRPFADQITEVLDVEFLELEYLRTFVAKIVEYRTKYGKHPSTNAMISIFVQNLIARAK